MALGAYNKPGSVKSLSRVYSVPKDWEQMDKCVCILKIDSFSGAFICLKRKREIPFPQVQEVQCTYRKIVVTYKTRKEYFARTLVLGFPASRTTSNKFVLFKPHSIQYFEMGVQT